MILERDPFPFEISPYGVFFLKKKIGISVDTRGSKNIWYNAEEDGIVGIGGFFFLTNEISFRVLEIKISRNALAFMREYVVGFR